MISPLILTNVFTIGPVAVSAPVVTTWALMALIGGGSFLATRRLKMRPSKAQATLEMLVDAIDSQIREIVRVEPAPYRSLIGTIFVFTLCANWLGLIPGPEPPTSRLETDAALAGIVFVSTIYFGVKNRGPLGYLKTFAEPTWAMLPLNIVEQITRTFSLIVRLFGNVMSGVFVIAVMLMLAGLLVPIPLMALELLTGAVQAYIFAVLATVFIGAAVGEGTEWGRG